MPRLKSILLVFLIIFSLLVNAAVGSTTPVGKEKAEYLPIPSPVPVDGGFRSISVDTEKGTNTLNTPANTTPEPVNLRSPNNCERSETPYKTSPVTTPSIPTPTSPSRPANKPSLSVDTNIPDEPVDETFLQALKKYESDLMEYGDVRDTLATMQAFLLVIAAVVFIAIVIYAVYYIRLIKKIYDEKDLVVE